MTPPTERPTARPRYEPAPAAPSDSARPVGGTIRRPSVPSTTNYQPRDPAPSVSTPTLRRPTTSPRTGDVRATTPRATNRYAPRDTTPTTTRTTRTPEVAVARPRPSNPTATTGASRGSTTTNPQLVPRSPAPRLTLPRSAAARSIQSGLVGHARSEWHDGGLWCGTTTHHTFWDPTYHYGYHHGHACYTPYSYYRWGCHHGLGFGVSLWFPWWGVSYSSGWWDTYYSPAYSGYWWYPASTYCPSVLYVPSSTVVVERVVEAPPPSDTVVVAGGGVVGHARATDAPAGATETLNLAAKYVELGDFYFRTDRFAEAAEAYGKARHHAPEDATVHFLLADAVFATGDYHYAAFLIAEGLRLDPALATADTDKRDFYSSPAVFEAQEAALDRYLASRPYDAQAHSVRGYNLQFTGEPKDADAAFRRVLEIDPENRVARLFLASRGDKTDKD